MVKLKCSSVLTLALKRDEKSALYENHLAGNRVSGKYEVRRLKGNTETFSQLGKIVEERLGAFKSFAASGYNCAPFDLTANRTF